MSTLISALIRPSVPSAAQRSGQVAAAVQAVGVGPLSEGLLAIEPDQVDVVAVRHALERLGHLQQECGGRSAIVGAHKAHAGHLLGVVVSAEDHRAARLARKSRDDVHHRNGAERRLPGEAILGDLASTQLQLRDDIGAQIAQRGGSRRARSERDDLARVFHGARAAEFVGLRCQRQPSRPNQNQDDFFAVHMYPSVKLRSWSRKSRQGIRSAGGTSNSAAGMKAGPAEAP